MYTDAMQRETLGQKKETLASVYRGQHVPSTRILEIEEKKAGK